MQSTVLTPHRKGDAPKSFLDRARGAATNFASNAKAAGQIAKKQAERLKINQQTLPHAYWALGKDIHSSGRYRDEFGDLYAKVDGLLERIQKLRLTQPMPSDQPQKLTDRAKAAAGHATDLAKAKGADMEANSALRELGKRAFEKHRDSSGPATLTGPITTALSHLHSLTPKSGNYPCPMRAAF